MAMGRAMRFHANVSSPEKRLHFTNCISMAHARNQHGRSTILSHIFPERTCLTVGHTCFGRIIQRNGCLSPQSKKLTFQRRWPNSRLKVSKRIKLSSAEVIRKREHDYKPNKINTESSADEKIAAYYSDRLGVDLFLVLESLSQGGSTEV